MIYDCFMFFNELDLLEIRLNELAGVVDRFVLVESPQTFTHRPKPLHYADNRSRFAQFQSKIIHVVVEDMPSCGDDWQREIHQRNCIARGLRGCRDDDTIILSDLDEIPRASAIKKVSGPVGFELRLSYYYLNYITQAPWMRSGMLPFGLLRQMPQVQAAREMAFPKYLKDAGWHFSYLGGVEQIREKIEAFSHQEFNQPRFTDPENLQRAIDQGRDPYGRDFQTFEMIDPHSLPPFVQRNLNGFRHLLWSEFHENWYSNQQCVELIKTYALAADLIGDVVEIGCWEGMSTAILANACHPSPLHAVDTWRGSEDESAEHPSAVIARQRDVHATFLKNVKSLTRGNVRPNVMRSVDFFAKQKTPIKFCHIDGSHDYRSVKADIEAALKHLLPMGVLCGDDFLSASADRKELDGGVERAVRELLPGFSAVGNFWSWQRPRASGDRHAKNPLNLPKNDPYFERDRRDVIDVILGMKIEPEKVLELGCSAGWFGQKLKQLLGIGQYTGIEREPEIAKAASQRLDQVHVADINHFTPADLGIRDNVFDMIVALDVLEHLENPWDVLARWTGSLKPGGYVVVSIPNIQNISVILNLARGRWDYESAGLLDVTHLRFFTLPSVTQLLNGAGLNVLHVSPTLRPAPDLAGLTDRGNNLQYDNVTISNLSRQDVMQLCTYQYVVVARAKT